MADPTASDAQGALSTGDNSNPAFPEPARVGDVTWVDIAPPSGEEHAHYIIPGIAGVEMSADGVAWGGAGNSLIIGAFNTATRIYLRIAAAADPAPKLVLPSSGFTAIVGNLAAGHAGSESGVVGGVDEREVIAGGAGAVTGVVGGAVLTGVRDASGVAGSASGVVGSATKVPDAAAGGAGSASGVVGAVSEKESVTGASGSASGVVGAATLASGAPFSGTYYLTSTPYDSVFLAATTNTSSMVEKQEASSRARILVARPTDGNVSSTVLDWTALTAVSGWQYQATGISFAAPSIGTGYRLMVELETVLGTAAFYFPDGFNPGAQSNVTIVGYYGEYMDEGEFFIFYQVTAWRFGDSTYPARVIFGG
jgi:hypothetical protein